MEKSLVKFSEADRDALAASIASSVFKEAVEKTTKADDADTGTFRVIISTEDRDRQGEIVSMKGWDLTFYKMNPVVLWAHDYWSQPIGVCTAIDIETIAGKQCLVASGKFAPTEVGQQIRLLYDGGFLKTTSVGFIPQEYDADTQTITKQQLLEFSFVPVPANPFAVSLAMAKEIGLDFALCAQKGIIFTVTKDADAEIETADDQDGDGEADQIGDDCTFDDGTTGVLAEDPKNPNGPLICVPTESKSAKTGDNDDGDDGDDDTGDDSREPEDDPYDLDPDVKALIKTLTKDATDEHDRHTGAIKKALDDYEEKMGELEDQRDSKGVAINKEEAMTDLRKKAAAEHETHLSKTKALIKRYAEGLKKALTPKDDDGNDGGNDDGKSMKHKSGAKLSKETKEQLAAIHKSITEAAAPIKDMLDGDGGKDHADDDKPDDKPEDGEDNGDASKGAPNKGSKKGKISDINEFVMGREIVRSLHMATTRAVENYNKRGREKPRGK